MCFCQAVVDVPSCNEEGADVIGVALWCMTYCGSHFILTGSCDSRVSDPYVASLRSFPVFFSQELMRNLFFCSGERDLVKFLLWGKLGDYMAMPQACICMCNT